jgi:hypothetical protein
MVKDAAQECLNSGIVGVDNIELYLKRRHHPSTTNLSPEPIQFTNEKLNRVVPVVDLRKYDALYLEGQQDFWSARRGTDGSRENASSDSSGGPGGSEAEVLGASINGGLCQDEGSGKRGDLKVSDPMDIKGEIRAQNPNDPKPDQISQVQTPSDGREF